MRYDNVQTQEPTLFRSMDAGTTWNVVEATVPEEVSNFSIKDLEDNGDNPTTIYADVGIILQSSDSGRNWQITY